MECTETPQTDSKRKRKNIREMSKCDECGYVVTTSEALRNHMENHRKHLAKFSCDVCNREFGRQKQLEKHTNKDHSAGDDCEWNCNDCSFQTNKESLLKKHKEVSRHPKKCDTCDVIVTTKTDLMNHRRAHHEGKSNMEDTSDSKCNICDTKFKNDEELKQHKKSHNQTATASTFFSLQLLEKIILNEKY